MKNYDFRNQLSAFEFECLTRDILRKRDGLDWENFAEGRDGGIDLRCSVSKGNRQFIAQAKRYKTYSELKSELAKEVEKVRKLAPQSYILSTSVDLTAANKTEIKQIFSPYILADTNILGRQDLNKYLSDYPDVERLYYKLWLSSTDVIEAFLHKEIVNWSEIELNEICESVRKYVMNDSFDEALNILIQNRYVIISGTPGVGKTTLARLLVMMLMSEGFKDPAIGSHYDSFYYITGSMDEATKMLQKGKRQIFFFDDFLGTNVFSQTEMKFDSKVIAFIKEIRRQNDKLLILVTREYILQDAMSRYSRFKENEFELAKCIVDVGHYTRLVKAKILYNHLDFYDIPPEYLQTIVKDKNYYNIIQHKNFSPRLIDTFAKRAKHEDCEPALYFEKVMDYFDHPSLVWKDAFEHLPILARYALYVFNTMGTHVMYDDWELACSHFFSKNNSVDGKYEETAWDKAVKVLLDCFIKITNGHEGLYVEFHNPGVKDVLNQMISDHQRLQEQLLSHSLFLEQVYTLFQDSESPSTEVQVCPQLYDAVMQAFDNCWHHFKSCNTIGINQSGMSVYYQPNPITSVGALCRFSISFPTIVDKYPKYIESKVTPEMLFSENQYLLMQLTLLEFIDLKNLGVDENELFESYKKRLSFGYECVHFAKIISKSFPSHLSFIDSFEFSRIVEDCVEMDIDVIDDGDYNECYLIVEELSNMMPSWNPAHILGRIDEANQKYEDALDAMIESHYEFSHDTEFSENEENRLIDNIFLTLTKRRDCSQS